MLKVSHFPAEHHDENFSLMFKHFNSSTHVVQSPCRLKQICTLSLSWCVSVLPLYWLYLMRHLNSYTRPLCLGESFPKPKLAVWVWMKFLFCCVLKSVRMPVKQQAVSCACVWMFVTCCRISVLTSTARLPAL